MPVMQIIVGFNRQKQLHNRLSQLPNKIARLITRYPPSKAPQYIILSQQPQEIKRTPTSWNQPPLE